MATREIVAARADGTIIRTNWTQLAHDARRMAQALERLGIRTGRPRRHAGDEPRSPPRPPGSASSAWAACSTRSIRGCSTTSSNYIANHAEDRVLLYDCAFAADRRAVEAAAGPTIEHYICFDRRLRRAWLGRAEDGDYAWVEGDERDPCGLCYTSGTTGNPKGVLYEHRSTVLHAMSIIAPDVFDLSARSVLLPVVPMFHANSWCLPYAARDHRPASWSSARTIDRSDIVPPVSMRRGSPIRPACRPCGWA